MEPMSRMSFGLRYYSPEGEPMELMEWAKLFEARSEDMALESWWRKHTELPGQVHVSTVWMGIDHQWGDGPPLFWETMVFGGEHSDDYWRYSSRQEAFDDHERIVKALREGREP